MNHYRPPKIIQKWEIWWVDQAGARFNTDPPQPLDPKKPKRMYLVIADPKARNAVTCCPIQDKGTTVYLTEVELIVGYDKFVTKDCKIVCHQIFTLERKHFINREGVIKSAERDKVNIAIVSYLGLITSNTSKSIFGNSPNNQKP